jgi:general L-amino acid transport system permease protein
MYMSESSRILSSEQKAVPFWRDIRVLSWAFQIIVLILVIALIAFLGRNLANSLDEIGLKINFNFLSRPAGFNISEGPLFDRESSILDAYMVGVFNTLRAAFVGVILATTLGVVVGVARLSNNWLVRMVSLVYIEIMQNTPLLVQLFFWFVLIRGLPPQTPDTIVAIPGQDLALGPIAIPTLAYLSQRGAAIVGVQLLDTTRFWIVLVIGLAAAYGAWRYRVMSMERAGHPATGQFWLGLSAALLVMLIGWFVTGGLPFQVTMPQLAGNVAGTIFRYEGGSTLTNNFQALMLGLVLYTAAFIAEVVRSGIQAVAYGQIEAATALGFSRGQRLRLIILPQAMRVIIPPLINQYLNLVKNSSLAIAVAYPDLFNISQTIGNQTGQNTQVILMVMGTYLLFSLIISSLMNLVNSRMQIKER